MSPVCVFFFFFFFLGWGLQVQSQSCSLKVLVGMDVQGSRFPDHPKQRVFQCSLPEWFKLNLDF